MADVKERGLAGSSDRDLLTLAHTEGRVLLTHDADFGAWVAASGGPPHGIVYLRPGQINPTFTIAALETLFAQELELSSPLLVVFERTEKTVNLRVRRV